MKITALALGSRGDVQPAVALGVGLQNAGYEVCVNTHAPFQEHAQNRATPISKLKVEKFPPDSYHYKPSLQPLSGR